MPKKILFINQEISPYIPESCMSVLGRQLPETFQESGYEIRTFMPKWGTINERRGQLHEVIRLSGLNINIGGNDHTLMIKIASIPVSRVQVYFIDNEDYFTRRRMAEDEQGEEYTDNGERAIFFARGVLETVKKLRWTPDIIICQGWMGAIVPLYLKTVFADEPCFENAKVITTVFDEQLKENLDEGFKRCLEYQEITGETVAPYKDVFDAQELGKIAIDYCDALCIASEEINPFFAEYANEKGIPVLNYSESRDKEAYIKLFEELTK